MLILTTPHYELTLTCTFNFESLLYRYVVFGLKVFEPHRMNLNRKVLLTQISQIVGQVYSNNLDSRQLVHYIDYFMVHHIYDQRFKQFMIKYHQHVKQHPSEHITLESGGVQVSVGSLVKRKKESNLRLQKVEVFRSLLSYAAYCE